MKQLAPILRGADLAPVAWIDEASARFAMDACRTALLDLTVKGSIAAGLTERPDHFGLMLDMIAQARHALETAEQAAGDYYGHLMACSGES